MHVPSEQNHHSGVCKTDIFRSRGSSEQNSWHIVDENNFVACALPQQLSVQVLIRPCADLLTRRAHSCTCFQRGFPDLRNRDDRKRKGKGRKEVGALTPACTTVKCTNHQKNWLTHCQPASSTIWCCSLKNGDDDGKRKGKRKEVGSIGHTVWTHRGARAGPIIPPSGTKKPLKNGFEICSLSMHFKLRCSMFKPCKTFHEKTIITGMTSNNRAASFHAKYK